MQSFEMPKVTFQEYDKAITGCPGYFSPFLKGYNLANNRLRAKILACECDLWAAILFETKKFFLKILKKLLCFQKMFKDGATCHVN